MPQEPRKRPGFVRTPFRWFRGSQGQAIVEAAIAMPLLLLILVGTVDVGSTFWMLTRWQHQAGVAADRLALLGETVERPPACTSGTVRQDATVRIEWTCEWASLTTLLPGTYTVEAEAVLP